MKITGEIREVHKKLSQCSFKFLEFVEKNPESLNYANYSDLECDDVMVYLQPWPTFINRQMKNEIKDAAAKVVNLIKSIPRRLFDNDPEKISSYFEITLEEAELALFKVTEKHLNNVLGRGDFIMTPLGELKCIEYNIASNIGGWQLPIWQGMYMKNPIIAKFIGEYRIKINDENLISILLKHLIDTIDHSNVYRDEPVNTAIVVPNIKPGVEPSQQEKYIDLLYKKILKKKYGLPAPGGVEGKIFFCDYSHLRVSGDSLYYNSMRLNCVLEFYGGYVPFSVLGIWAKGGVNIFNGPVTMITANKLNLALLSQHEDSELFTPGERESIKKYIPWTRKMCDGETMDSYKGEEIRLKDFIIAEREKLILKPSNGYGAEGMCPGKHMSAEEWGEAVRKAFKEKAWVVQECIESASFLYQSGETGSAPHNVVLGIFMAGPNYAGAWMRILRSSADKGIISSHQGAYDAIILEVDE
ncbi:MAG: circularly permuted type 2 ATP-grasp protein [bacterium]|nr:circularly permuted type 2 ATP-grasp protein [bacterium]